MATENTARVRRESLNVESVDHEGWSLVEGSLPKPGEQVMCVEGQAEVVKILGRTSDGSRLLELRLPDRPKQPFFAAASNVMRKDARAS